jgi:hypothetical protein
MPMAELGIRSNVMGPQPIAARKSLPPEMLEAAERVVMMFMCADGEGLAAFSVSAIAGSMRAIAAQIAPESYTRHAVVATARVIQHYYVKVRMFGEGVEPFTIQFRLGKQNNQWLLWEVINLTGRRGAWTP